VKYLFWAVLALGVAGYLFLVVLAQNNQGSEEQFVLLVKLTAAGLTVTGIGWWLEELLVRPRRPSFAAKGIRFALTPDEKAVRIWTGDSQEPGFVPYGALTYESHAQTTTVTRHVNAPGSINTVTGSNMATVSAPTSYSYDKQVPTGFADLRFTEVIVDEFQPDAPLPVRKGSEQWARVDASVAKAAMRWLHAHRKTIAFNYDATKKRTIKDREKALRDVRAACGVNPKKVLEAVAWTPKRASQVAGYFAMTEDGQGILWSERGVEKLSLDDLRARLDRTGAYEKPTFKVSTPTGDCRVEWTADMGKRVERLSRKR
jgi:hypothetical protein